MCIKYPFTNNFNLRQFSDIKQCRVPHGKVIPKYPLLVNCTTNIVVAKYSQFSEFNYTTKHNLQGALL
jgi:hypothetical protein